MASVTRIVLPRTSVAARCMSTAVTAGKSTLTCDVEDLHPQIGDREIVGPGFNYHANYMDRFDYPFPAIRFKSFNNPEMQALREKERGDWKNLTIEEKKKLYRASFRLTLIEAHHPTGDWKAVLAGILFGTAVCGLIHGFYEVATYEPFPKSMEKEWIDAVVRRNVVQRQGEIAGSARLFDYEKNDWKR